MQGKQQNLKPCVGETVMSKQVRTEEEMHIKYITHAFFFKLETYSFKHLFTFLQHV